MKPFGTKEERNIMEFFSSDSEKRRNSLKRLFFMIVLFIFVESFAIQTLDSHFKIFSCWHMFASPAQQLNELITQFAPNKYPNSQQIPIIAATGDVFTPGCVFHRSATQVNAAQDTQFAPSSLARRQHSHFTLHLR
jgi:hypothetical protein